MRTFEKTTTNNEKYFDNTTTNNEKYFDDNGFNTGEFFKDEFFSILSKNKTLTSSLQHSNFKNETEYQETNTAINTDNYRENLFQELSNIRNKLMEAFDCQNQHDVAEIISGEIKRLNKCAFLLGYEFSDFDPLDHYTGLANPDFHNNVEKVIENTLKHYQLGSVKIQKANNQQIKIAFSGVDNYTKYSALGVITPNNNENWDYNQAIDYIYTPGSGKMSVKAFKNGKWIDESKNFDISWELSEIFKKSQSELESELDLELEPQSETQLESQSETQLENEDEDDFDIIEN